MTSFIFDTINSINEESNFEKKIFLTFDIDWALDEVIDDTLNLLNNYELKATFFITHKGDYLKKLKEKSNYELGIHPNFNNLLFNNNNNLSCESIIENLIDIVGNPKSIRSHHLTQSSSLLNLFSKYNINYDCNSFIPYQSKLVIKPWKLWNELTIVPHFWEDDISMLYKNRITIDELTHSKGLKVFNFHPIHIFLNTSNMEQYEKARPHFKNFKELKKFKSKEFGIRDVFKQLVSKNLDL